MARANPGVVDLFGLVVEFNLDGVDLEALDKGFFWGNGRLRNGGVFELEEAGEEVEGVLVDVETEREYLNLEN